MFMKTQFFYSYFACLLLLTANVSAEQHKPVYKTVDPTKKAAVEQKSTVEKKTSKGTTQTKKVNKEVTADTKYLKKDTSSSVDTKKPQPQAHQKQTNNKQIPAYTAHSDKPHKDDKHHASTQQTNTTKHEQTKSKNTREKQCPTMSVFIPDNCVDAVRAHYMQKHKCKEPSKPKRVIDSIKFAPYVGVEYMFQHIPTSADWHSAGFMPSNLDVINGFVGLRYHRNFAIEFGGYHTIRRSQAQSNVSEFEGQAATGDTLVIAQLENKGFSIDWSAHCFLDPKFNVFAIVGMANYQPKLNILTSENTDLGTALRLVKGHNTNVFRLGVGMEYLECWWGVRARVIWDNTQSMRLDVIEAQQFFSSISPRAFGQTILVTVGLFYRF